MRTSACLFVLAAMLQVACLRPQVVANCEIHGTVVEEDCATPVPDVMVWSLYDLKSDRGNLMGTKVVGPFLSDPKGRFVVPRMEAGGEAVQRAEGEKCPVRLMFIHPARGAFSIRICPEDYPLGFASRDMVVHQPGPGPNGNPEMVRASYRLLSDLPPEHRSTAWQHVDPSLRPR